MDAATPPRVLVIGSQSFSDTMEWHVVDSLSRAGVPVRLFECRAFYNTMPKLFGAALAKTTALLLREPERLLERRLVRSVAEFSPSLVLVLLGSQLSPKTVTLLRAHTDSPIVCWCQDQLSTLGRQYVLGAGYDLVFVKDRYLQDLFSRMVRSTAFQYLPEACNPRVHHPVTLSERDAIQYNCEVMIAGTLYYYRQEILRQLTKFDLKIWGDVPDWLQKKVSPYHAGRQVSGVEKCRAAAGARICLNTLHLAEINGLNCRAFELAGCAGFQLITSVPVLAEHFAPDQELVTFSTIDELIEKVTYYLAHPDKARAIARRGMERALRDHTYEHRLQQIFASVWGRVPQPAQPRNSLGALEHADRIEDMQVSS
jgi:spore maturation protein CgeB